MIIAGNRCNCSLRVSCRKCATARLLAAILRKPKNSAVSTWSTAPRLGWTPWRAPASATHRRLHAGAHGWVACAGRRSPPVPRRTGLIGSGSAFRVSSASGYSCLCCGSGCRPTIDVRLAVDVRPGVDSRPAVVARPTSADVAARGIPAAVTPRSVAVVAAPRRLVGALPFPTSVAAAFRRRSAVAASDAPGAASRPKSSDRRSPPLIAPTVAASHSAAAGGRLGILHIAACATQTLPTRSMRTHTPSGQPPLGLRALTQQVQSARHQRRR